MTPTSHTLEPPGIPGRFRSLHEGEVWVPALKIPTVQKDGFECPDEHIRTLEDRLHKVDRILVVGWKGTEKPFLNLLGKHLTGEVFITVVSDSQENGDATYRQLASTEIRVKGATVIAGGFSAFVEQRLATNLFD